MYSRNVMCALCLVYLTCISLCIAVMRAVFIGATSTPIPTLTNCTQSREIYSAVVRGQGAIFLLVFISLVLGSVLLVVAHMRSHKLRMPAVVLTVTAHYLALVGTVVIFVARRMAPNWVYGPATAMGTVTAAVFLLFFTSVLLGGIMFVRPVEPTHKPLDDFSALRVPNMTDILHDDGDETEIDLGGSYSA